MSGGHAPRVSTGASIMRAENRGSYIVYIIKVHQNGREWLTMRRYSEFDKLRRSLEQEHPEIELDDFPSKAMFNLRQKLNLFNFTEQRRQALDDWLEELTSQIRSFGEIGMISDFFAPCDPSRRG